MRKFIIRLIDLILSYKAQIAWLAVILLFLLLTGCASAPYTDRMLKEADKHVAAVQWLDVDDLQATCGLEIKVSGCAKLMTGEIYLLDHPHRGFRDCVLRHERSHIYDVYVKGMTMEQTQAHEGWIVPDCYLPH